mmetsp:Transcript_4013/g.10142  ORF Transcript_4013/g.10142 Transcript_4013/m.10142 type:complete len:134 (-) Transcript_4013:1774-2175(-)|eukprot:jgi/Tetstr1/432971/TSEL_022308.t1
MATVGELKEVLKETLQRNGVAEKIKGQVRAEVFKALDSKQSGGAVPLSDENLIINELIREYLNFNQYQETLSVLVPETGQPERPAFDRAFMARHLRIQEDMNTRQVPLLYTLIARGSLWGDTNPRLALSQSNS